LGIELDVYHFNEGHALFAGFELLREEMEGDERDKKQETRNKRQETTT
jgi:glycogen phosphorylase